MKARRREFESVREALASGHCRQLALEIAAWIGGDRLKFSELVDHMVGRESGMASRAAWVARFVVEGRPSLLGPHLPRLLCRIEEPGVHPAVPRELFRMLQTTPISGDCEGRVLSAAFAALGGPVPVAVKVYALTVLKRLAGTFPGILEEARVVIEEQLPYSSPALHCRARQVFGTGKSGRMG